MDFILRRVLNLKKISYLRVWAIIFITLFVTHCSKGSAGRSASRKTTTTTTQTTPPTTTDKNVGEEVPPVTSETGASTTTSSEAQLKHFTIQTAATSIPVDGRYLDEFLFVIHAQEKSCIKLSVRPGLSATNGADVGNIPNPVEDLGACESKTALALTTSQTNSLGAASEQQSNPLDFKEKIIPSSGFSLTAAATSLCSQSNFYMQSKGTQVSSDPFAHSQDPSKVVLKIGTLIAKSADDKVLVYADQEWLPISYCNAAATDKNGFKGNGSFSVGVGDFGLVTPFNLLNSYSSNPYFPVYRGYQDILLKSHFSNLAKTTSDALSKLTTTFGPVSDVDSNAAVKVFISPEVNRVYHDVKYVVTPDDMNLSPIYKPMDLATYHPVKNPTSNQAETLYLWAPNPGGDYNYSSFPSANSINSNFAFGFLGFQIMNLIMDNHKLMKGVKEAPFLRESLAYLGGLYVGGSNYSWSNQAYYLASQSHNISLTDPIKAELFPDSTIFEGTYGQRGMRALFGWYLHSKVCSATDASPCLGLKTIMASTKSGMEAVEETLKLSWSAIVNNFAGTLGVGLVTDTDQNSEAIQERLKSTVAASGIPAPIILEKDLYTDVHAVSEIRAGNYLINPLTNISSYTVTSSNEKAYVSPYPNLTSHLFQPLLPDSQIDFSLQPHSITFLRVTGLMTETTDISAYVGPNTRVTVIPIGQRNPSKRAIYHEKRGENSYLDLRPINLTDEPESPVGSNIRYTWELSPPVSSKLNMFTVSKEKELWISGSIHNAQINVEGANTQVGDSDAYVIKLDPCNGPCPSTTSYNVVVQTYIRPGSESFIPMTFMGPTNKTSYHGAVAWGKVTGLDPSYTQDKDEIALLCHSAQLYSGNKTESNLCNNGGYNRILIGTSNESELINSLSSPSTGASTNFINSICAKGPAGHIVEDACWGSDYKTPMLFDSRLRMNLSLDNLSSTTKDETNYGYGYLSDNFLMSAYGYPYDNAGSLQHESDKPADSPGPKPFTKEEANRMFLNFKWNKDLKPKKLKFHTARNGFAVDPASGALPQATLIDGGVYMDDTIISAFLDAKSVIETKNTPLLDTDPFIAKCTSAFELDTATCAAAGSTTALFIALKAKIVEKKWVVKCSKTDLAECPISQLFEATPTSASATPAVDKLFDDIRRFIWLQPASTSPIKTYYKPMILKGASYGLCSGEGKDYAPSAKGWLEGNLLSNEFLDRQNERLLPPLCNTSENNKFVHDKIEGNDIREQLWLPSTLIGCSSFPDQNQLCFDTFTTSGQENFGDLLNSGSFSCQNESGDLLRDTRGPINFRKGEMLALDGRIHKTEFQIKGVVDASKYATYGTLVIGGRNQTTGDYLMRVRITPVQSSCHGIPDGIAE